MALTDTQRQTLLDAKARGLSKQQAMALAFKSAPAQAPGGRFSDVRDDIVSAGTGAFSDINQRATNIRDSFAAGKAGAQSPIETGAQTAGNLLGGAGDLAFRGVQAAVTPLLAESEERAIQSGAEKVLAPVAEKIAEQSPRTQRNITGALGLFEGATASVGTSAVKPVTSAVGKLVNKFRGTTDNVPAKPAVRTPEQVFQQADEGLKRQANDPNLTPEQQEAAANSALTFKERYIGLTPDVKARLAEMGPEKLQEYLDVTHMRNISDKNPGPYEVGANNVRKAEEQLSTALNETGSGIGQIRKKLGTFKMSQPQVQNIDRIFKGEIEGLGLTIKNGKVIQRPNAITAAGTGDIRAINELLQDVNTFKQSPTLTNAIDLRKNFDAKIKFGKSARDVSNEVDPLSRAVRSTIAKEAGLTVGKENAALVTQYSEFMDAYGDLRSFTNRAAGGEYLLRLVLSGRGGEARQLINTIKDYTGVDLMNDATAMKVATQTLGNENTQNLFRQEVTNAGYDAAAVASGSPVGLASVIGKRLLDMGINAEDVLKASAAGTAGYVLMTYYGEDGMLPAGITVLSAMPSAGRKAALKQADELAKSSNRVLKLADVEKDAVAKAILDVNMQDLQTPRSKAGGTTVDFADIEDLENIQKGLETPAGITDQDYIEAKAILEKYDLGKAKSATTQTTLLEEAKDSVKPLIEEVEKLRPNQKPVGAEMFRKENGDIVQMTDIVARERFNIPELEKVSFGGSDRDVYDLGDGNVVKIAKSARGLAQNSMADYYAADSGLIPDIKEIGRNYVVFEKVDAPDANTKKLVAELKKIGLPSRGFSSKEYFDTVKSLQSKMEEYGYPGNELANYGDDLLWGDIVVIRNWGTKDGVPIMLDEGSLNGQFVKDFANSAKKGIKNMDDPEFREIYEISKTTRKKYGDLDKKTMYGITGLLMLGLGTQTQASQ